MSVRYRMHAIIRAACPGAGGCGIAASFNTWGITMEAIGLMLFSSSIPAIDPAKKQECSEVGHLLKRLLETGIRPRDILNRKALKIQHGHGRHWWFHQRGDPPFSTCSRGKDFVFAEGSTEDFPKDARLM